ncbi:hypothetical protein CL176_02205 [Suicoccus acidiformans]|uniref:Uncharacterized protein n=1 Tax=Suicoccus acidiformans TaxID=2036206 RepID=A0A347WIM4_9LACT|nr:hypothetical protein [Suicoccus acidiformans]AXY24931.1 hypothetical protein CL176_02205 [Suicoccus acidiformans]
MKLTTLQKILGEQLELLAGKSETLQPIDVDKANAITAMSKQIINNASVILRAERQNGKAKEDLI